MSSFFLRMMRWGQDGNIDSWITKPLHSHYANIFLCKLWRRSKISKFIWSLKHCKELVTQVWWPVTSWPPQVTLGTWSRWHHDMMTLTLRILLVVLTILYISYLNTQINSQDKSTSATNVSYKWDQNWKENVIHWFRLLKMRWNKGGSRLQKHARSTGADLKYLWNCTTKS